MVFPSYINRLDLPSFRRYMGTILLAEILCFIFLVIDKFKDKDIIEHIAGRIAKNKKS